MDSSNFPTRSCDGRICSTAENIAYVKKIEVLEVGLLIDSGKECDPVRDAIQYWTVDGKFIGQKELTYRRDGDIQKGW